MFLGKIKGITVFFLLISFSAQIATATVFPPGHPQFEPPSEDELSFIYRERLRKEKQKLERAKSIRQNEVGEAQNESIYQSILNLGLSGEKKEISSHSLKAIDELVRSDEKELREFIEKMAGEIESLPMGQILDPVQMDVGIKNLKILVKQSNEAMGNFEKEGVWRNIDALSPEEIEAQEKYFSHLQASVEAAYAQLQTYEERLKKDPNFGAVQESTTSKIFIISHVLEGKLNEFRKTWKNLSYEERTYFVAEFTKIAIYLYLLSANIQDPGLTASAMVQMSYAHVVAAHVFVVLNFFLKISTFDVTMAIANIVIAGLYDVISSSIKKPKERAFLNEKKHWFAPKALLNYNHSKSVKKVKLNTLKTLEWVLTQPEVEKPKLRAMIHNLASEFGVEPKDVFQKLTCSNFLKPQEVF